MKFEDLQFKPKENGTIGTQAVVEFPNRYGASIIRGPYTYGGSAGLYELAVLYEGALCYDSGITEDVIGWLKPEEVDDLLEKIESLPPKKK